MSTAGDSLLTQAQPPAAPPPPAPGSAEAAVKAVQDGPPEWAIGKYWNAELAKKDMSGYLPTYAQEVSKGYKNIETLVGRDKVPIPTSDDDEEGWHRWYAASGRPEKPDQYEFARPDKLPDGLDYDEDLEKDYRQWAHANGLNKRQAKAFYDGWVKKQVERHAAYHESKQKSLAEARAALQREHGDYSAVLAQAGAAMNQFADPDFRAYLDESGAGNDPRMIRTFYRIGKALNGETRLQGKAPTAPNPADLDKAMSSFRAQHKEALFDRAHPDHDARVAELRKLYEQRFPESAA